MPTPSLYSKAAIDGVVPGQTWSQFLTNFTGNTDASQGTFDRSVGGLGNITAQKYISDASRFANGEGGFYNANDGAAPTYNNDQQYYNYVQPLGDGTQNVFTSGENGDLVSHNKTIDDDSWWDSTGTALAMSLAFGGVTGALASAGVGAGVSGLGAGAANVGAGYASSGGLGGYAGGLGGNLAGSVIGSAGGGLSNVPQSVASGALEYAPAGNTEGFLQNAADNTLANGAQQAGNWYDPLSNAWNTASNAWGSVNPLLRTGISSLASEALNSGDGGPSGTGQSFSDAGYSAANNIPYSGNANDSFVPNLSTSNGSSSNPFSSLVKVYNSLTGQGDGADANDYWNLASTAGRIGSGFLNSNAASNAANRLTDSTNQANALTTRIYNDGTVLNAPYINSGVKSLDEQNNLLGLKGTAAQQDARTRFTASPDFQFRLDQGLKAAGNGAAAAGLTGSGRYLKDLNNYAQGQASQEYGNYFGRLGGITSLGQASANRQAALGSSFANSVGDNLTSGAGAQAAGTVGSANALTGALSGVLNDYGSSNALSRLLGLNLNGYYATR